jgi:hypothetical protein
MTSPIVIKHITVDQLNPLPNDTQAYYKISIYDSIDESNCIKDFFISSSLNDSLIQFKIAKAIKEISDLYLFDIQ